MKKIIMAALVTFAMISFAQAQEPTTSEKMNQTMENAGNKTKEWSKSAEAEAKHAGRKTKRMAKKGMHRAQEATCMDGDMKCAAKKAKNRAVEGKDATVDTMKDATDSMSK